MVNFFVWGYMYIFAQNSLQNRSINVISNKLKCMNDIIYTCTLVSKICTNVKCRYRECVCASEVIDIFIKEEKI